MHIEQASHEQLQSELTALETRYAQLADQQLALDLTRGKPGSEQLDLSAQLDGILQGDYFDAHGTDVRNYGGIEGLPEARALFASILDCSPAETLIGGNSSLSLMYMVLDVAMRFGLRGADSAWQHNGKNRFICPVPGYDRHFTVCERLGIDMVPVPLLDTGPDMAAVEALVAADETIRGIWCIPRFSNPTGCVYDDDTVERLARLAERASGDFLVMWDNTYVVHALTDSAPRFNAVLNALEAELSGCGMGRWTTPEGGYFIAFDTLPGLATEVVRLAAAIGVKLTPAGATFPYGKDPQDSNIRLAPTFPTLADVQAAAEAFVVCVKLASIRQRLA